jgi:hypothetical protein
MEDLKDTIMEKNGVVMRKNILIIGVIWIVSAVAGCSKVSEEELQSKIDKCTSAGMNYTYLRDFKGDPYEVMCVSKRLR